MAPAAVAPAAVAAAPAPAVAPRAPAPRVPCAAAPPRPAHRLAAARIISKKWTAAPRRRPGPIPVGAEGPIKERITTPRRAEP